VIQQYRTAVVFAFSNFRILITPQTVLFSFEIHFSFRFYKFLYSSFLFLYYIRIILDNYFRFYKFSYGSFLFLYYIRFDIVRLAYFFHTNQLESQQSAISLYSNALRKMWHIVALVEKNATQIPVFRAATQRKSCQ